MTRPQEQETVNEQNKASRRHFLSEASRYAVFAGPELDLEGAGINWPIARRV